MEKAELIERLKGYEWKDVEFKRAQKGVPDSAYETVSAFANTEGGWLVFGVYDSGHGFEVVGVLEVDKVQSDFLSVLRAGQKLNRVITTTERMIEDDGKTLLVFHVPEARRQHKPVYVGRDIRRSFIRRGAGDERCTPAEIERLLRDAADERYDGETVDLDPEHCFEDSSLRWYRRLGVPTPMGPCRRSGWPVTTDASRGDPVRHRAHVSSGRSAPGRGLAVEP